MNRLIFSLKPAASACITRSIRVPTTSSSFVRYFSNSQTFLDRNEVSDRVLSVIKNFEKVDPVKVEEGAKFIEDLGLDSLDVVEVVMAVEEEFVVEIPDNEAEKLTTPSEVIDYISAHPMAK